MELKTAKREQVNLKVGISGPSGFGKTYSALLMAHGMTNDWSKIGVIDTENNSASLYAHLGHFKTLCLTKPYNPEKYIEAIQTCQKSDIKVIILDSISHEWNGPGGCLEIHNNLGGRWQDWGAVTPRHQNFIAAILESTCHIITTTRRKMNYSMESDSNGKTRVIKHGLKEITRDGFEYELTVNFELTNENHLAKASKDRTGLFMGKPEFIINSKIGKKLIEWCNHDVIVQEIIEKINSCTSVEELRKIYESNQVIKEEIYPLVMSKKTNLEALKSHVINDSKII
tara:strand:- start:6841 stop:7695 length:855 start_codon:yes stop_codon:yes gene_type:complete